MQIVLVPDKFKGTLTATEAARAMGEGVHRAVPDAVVHRCPIADGGEGTLHVLSGAGAGRIESVRVTNGGRPDRYPVLVLSNGARLIESATTYPSPTDPPTPLRSSTVLLGRLIATVASDGDPAPLFVAVGGTLSTDGGTGAASACGWRFLDRSGTALAPGGGSLIDLAHIVPPEGERVKVSAALCDVDVPLTGPHGSARAFGPQKGANPAEVEALENGLANLEERIRSDLGIDAARLAFAGAGGGLGAGLAAFFGAELRSGFDHVADAIGLEARIRAADLVITGEGRLDRQSLAGKAPVGVARLARSCGVPCSMVTGRRDVDDGALRAEGITSVGVLDPSTGDAAQALADATATALEGWSRD